MVKQTNQTTEKDMQEGTQIHPKRSKAKRQQRE